MGSSLRKLRRQQERYDSQFVREMENASADRQKAALYRNGITLADAEREYKRGWNDAKKDVEQFCFHTIYAAVLITLVENGLCDSDGAADILKKIDQQVVFCVEDKELAEEAYKKTGISLEWDDPLERVHG